MKKLLLLLMIVLALNIKLKAEIIYTDIEPDKVLFSTLTTPMYYDLDIDANGAVDFCIAHHETIQFFSAYNGSMALSRTNPYDYSEPSVIEMDDSINVNSKDWISNYGSINLTERWDGQSNKYIGLKFKQGAEWHYGWLEISIPNDHHNCIVHGFAYNSVPNEGIKAGETSSTSIKSESFDTEILLYPNPAKDYLVIDNFYQGKIEIYSVNGLKLLECENTNLINIHELVNGIYFVRSDNKIKKFIKN
jgi:hypothetical protein